MTPLVLPKNSKHEGGRFSKLEILCSGVGGGGELLYLTAKVIS